MDHGVCAHQAMATYGILRNERGMHDDYVFITTYEWESTHYRHQVVTIRDENDIIWVLDNDSTLMPIQEAAYLQLWPDIFVAFRFSIKGIWDQHPSVIF